MSGLLPRTTDASTIDHDPGALRVPLDAPEADALFATLSCANGRRIVRELQAEPLTPARLAERVGTSLQNALYHLSRLEEAGLVEVVATDVSEKGLEMDVYAPAGDPILVTAGDGSLDGVGTPVAPRGTGDGLDD